MKNIKIFLLKIFIFYNLKNFCILHGHVFVMFAKAASFNVIGSRIANNLKDKENKYRHWHFLSVSFKALAFVADAPTIRGIRLHHQTL